MRQHDRLIPIRYLFFSKLSLPASSARSKLLSLPKQINSDWVAGGIIPAKQPFWPRRIYDSPSFSFMYLGCQRDFFALFRRFAAHCRRNSVSYAGYWNIQCLVKFLSVGCKQKILQRSGGPSTLIAFLSLFVWYSRLKNASFFKMQQHGTPGLLAVSFFLDQRRRLKTKINRTRGDRNGTGFGAKHTVDPSSCFDDICSC